jgi:phosphatidylethanolamine-binding protein (PEBP) family uncharacterized protein
MSTTVDPKTILAKLEEDEVIPDVLHPFEPKAHLHVGWSDKVFAKFGNMLPLDEIKHAPLDVSFSHEPDKFYTMIMSDPDAPSRKAPLNREWLHWIIINMPNGGSRGGGTHVVGWYPPTPPPLSGPHRYVCSLFEQPGKIASDQVAHIRAGDPHGRAKFKTSNWEKQYNLTLIGANFFRAEDPTRPA